MTTEKDKKMAPTKDLRETLAEVQHEIWAHWMRYQLSVCMRGGNITLDGDVVAGPVVVIPRDKVERWERQLATPYEELSEKEKYSDREQADKILEVLGKHILNVCGDRNRHKVRFWVKVDQCDNAYCGVFTKAEKKAHEKETPPSDTGYYWEEHTYTAAELSSEEQDIPEVGYSPEFLALEKVLFNPDVEHAWSVEELQDHIFAGIYHWAKMMERKHGKK